MEKKFNINTEVNGMEKVHTVDNFNGINNSSDNELLILKKQSSRDAKPKAVQIYLENDLYSKVNLILKQTGMKSRNDLIVELLKFAVNKVKVID